VQDWIIRIQKIVIYFYQNGLKMFASARVNSVI